MITEHRSKTDELVFFVRHYTGLPFALLLAFDFSVAFAFFGMGWTWIAHPHIPLSLFGSALGVLVGFRFTGAYGRWWEARQLWGAVVNDSRSLARQALTFLSADQSAVCNRVVHLQIAYVHALRLQLRGQETLVELKPWLTAKDSGELAGQQNVALAIQQMIAVELSTTRDQTGLTEFAWMQIDSTLVRLANSQGGLERIKNTPMPQQYTHLLTVVVGLYGLLLPFGLIQNLGIMTPIGSSVLALIFLTLNKMGREIETPFANRPADLPLTAIATTIEIGLRQLIGEPKVPEATQAVGGVLW